MYSRQSHKFLDISKEIAVALKPVDVEIQLKKVVNPGRVKDKVVVGQGMAAPLKKARITSNVRVHRKVDKVMNDELKARVENLGSFLY